MNTACHKMVGSLLLASSFLFTGCSKLSVSQTDGSEPAIELTKFQGAPKAEWLLSEADLMWTASKELHLVGACARGVYAVQLVDDASGKKLGGTADCSNSQAFDWKYAVELDGIYSFSLWPLDRDGSIRGRPVTFRIGVNSAPPPAPVIITRGGQNFVSPTASVVLQGTVISDVGLVEAPGSDGTISFVPRSGEFSYSFNLNAGETRTISFVATNFLGTRSSPTTISVSYLPNLFLRLTALSSVQVNPTTLVSTGGQARIRNISLTPFASAPMGIVRAVARRAQ